MPLLTDAQLVVALQENGHEAEAQALEQKNAGSASQPAGGGSPAAFNAALRRAAGKG